VYVTRLPDQVSPVIVAEAIEATLGAPMAQGPREEARRAYLAAHSPARYARDLLELLIGTSAP
jgi:hypothetical protein